MNIVFLDDEDFLFPLIKRYFSMLNIDRFLCTTSPIDAYNFIINENCNYLLIDYNMPDIPDINKYVKTIPSNIKIVIVSGEDNSFIEDNIQFIYKFLKKPFVIDDLKKILEQ
ncbi:MAG: hypothetical protein A2015_16350 [Spirochaetes bacterium GWF1_31_7]|nr:MAG: hypothetical protein A2Y30_13715 [Spirochaetes bacterium GWE1_32_154]OHD50020.1 MAG: hypothetical protein A2Y29_11760 [Spirochaetes bacterium GWE2_31_10]OHD52334.1 MAG: hypothetical protein A2015_16350 [Spirochaetes bacterium GWF1_31_7]HBI38485.1 hypothetical protein [Spirochaetia bacterium]